MIVNNNVKVIRLWMCVDVIRDGNRRTLFFACGMQLQDRADEVADEDLASTKITQRKAVDTTIDDRVLNFSFRVPFSFGEFSKEFPALP